MSGHGKRQTVFQVGTKSVEFNAVCQATAPPEADVQQSLGLLATAFESGTDPFLAFAELSANIEHPWLLFGLCAAKDLYWRHGSGFVRYEDGSEFRLTPPNLSPRHKIAALSDVLSRFAEEEHLGFVEAGSPFALWLTTFLIGVHERTEQFFFEIGGNWASKKLVLRSDPPSNQAMADLCSLFGTLIGAGVPVLETLKLVGQAQTHPWLVAMSSILSTQIREGDSMAGGLERGFTTLMWERAQELALKAPPAELPANSASRTGGRYTVTKVYSGPNIEEWVIPNFIAFFKPFTMGMDSGESAGEVDTMLFSLERYFRNERRKPDGAFWSNALHLFFRDFAMLLNAGQPILRILRTSSKRHGAISQELDRICVFIEEGCTLSEAAEQAGGELSDPRLIALFRAGESSGALEIIFQKLV